MAYNILFLCTILATIASFMFSNTALGDGFMLVAQGCVILLFACAVFKQLQHRRKLPKLLALWIVCIIVALIESYIVPRYASADVLGSVREFFLPFAITYSAYFLFSADKKQFRNAFIIVGIVSIIAAIYILINTGGFEIYDLYREDINKNQTAPLFAQIGLVSLILALDDKSKTAKVIFFATFFMALTYCAVLRARTSTLSILLLAILVLWQRYKKRTLLILPLLIVAAVALYGDKLSEILQQSLFANHNAADMNDITSGRTSLMANAWDFFKTHILFGSLTEFSYAFKSFMRRFPITHMFLLWKLVKYGLIGSLPFLTMYFAVGAKGVKLALNGWRNNKYAILCLSVAYFTSLAEYCAPFGPGTSFILCYCLFGNSLRGEVNYGLNTRLRIHKNIIH